MAEQPNAHKATEPKPEQKPFTFIDMGLVITGTVSAKNTYNSPKGEKYGLDIFVPGCKQVFAVNVPKDIHDCSVEGSIVRLPITQEIFNGRLYSTMKV